MALAAWISRIGAARLTETCAAMLSCEISAKGSGIARPAIFTRMSSLRDGQF